MRTTPFGDSMYAICDNIYKFLPMYQVICTVYRRALTVIIRDVLILHRGKFTALSQAVGLLVKANTGPGPRKE